MIFESRSRPLLVAAFAVLATAAQSQVEVYTLTDIGPIYAGGVQYVAAINDNGQVTSTTPNRRGFVWDNGQTTILPDLEPSNFSYPHDLTSSGVVIGDSMVGVQPHATIWQAGVPTDLGVLGGLNSQASAGNESGQVVGWWELGGGGVETHAFLCDSGTFTDLGGLGGNLTRASSINEAGVIVGGSRLGVGSYIHAFVWRAGHLTDIGAWAGNDRQSIATAINDAGIVVGIIEPVFGNSWLAFRYENGRMVTIPGLPGADSSIPEAINNQGQLAGTTRFSDLTEVATLFQDEVAYDLNTLIQPGSGWQLLGASDINDHGQIVGIGLHQGSAHAFLLTPRSIITRYCTSTTNSSGTACMIDGQGMPSVSQNEFDLVATGVVPNKPGLFFYNDGQIQLPFGNGFLCVGGGAPSIFRLSPLVASNSSGVAVRHLDFDAAPAASGPGAILPLATWNFQYYFRDQAAGGANFNLSDAVSVTFCP